MTDQIEDLRERCDLLAGVADAWKDRAQAAQRLVEAWRERALTAEAMARAGSELRYCRLCGLPFETADGYTTCQRCNRGIAR